MTQVLVTRIAKALAIMLVLPTLFFVVVMGHDAALELNGLKFYPRDPDEDGVITAIELLMWKSGWTDLWMGLLQSGAVVGLLFVLWGSVGVLRGKSNKSPFAVSFGSLAAFLFTLTLDMIFASGSPLPPPIFVFLVVYAMATLFFLGYGWWRVSSVTFGRDGKRLD